MQSVRDLLALEFTRPPYIIEEGILNENSIMVIGGPPKSYKSFFSASIGMNLATGTNLFGAWRKRGSSTILAFNVVAPKRVLIFEQEIGDFSLKERMGKMADGLTGNHKDLFMDNLITHSCDRDLRLDTCDGLKRIGELTEKAQPEVVIFDPLIEFHQQDENSAQSMSKVMRNLDAYRDHFRIPVILAHHAAKPNDARQGPDNLRGSSAIYGKGDTFFMLEVFNRNAGIVKVSSVIRRDVPIRPFLIKIDWTDLICKFQDWWTEKNGEKAKSEANIYYQMM